MEFIDRITVKEDLVDKKPLGRPRLLCKDYMKMNSGSIKTEIPYRVAVEDRDGRREQL